MTGNRALYVCITQNDKGEEGRHSPTTELWYAECNAAWIAKIWGCQVEVRRELYDPAGELIEVETIDWP